MATPSPSATLFAAATAELSIVNSEEVTDSFDKLYAGLTAKEIDKNLNHSSNVRTYVQLDASGSNYPQWELDLRSAARRIGCHGAYFKAFPLSQADGAAMNLLLSSMSNKMSAPLARHPTAKHAYQEITKRYTGGANPNANRDWNQEMEAGIRSNESLDDWVMRVEVLYGCIKANNGIMAHQDAVSAIIDGLPEEMEPVRFGLYGSCCAKTFEEMRQTLQFAAHGLKFNDKLRRTASTPSVNHFRPTKGQQTPKETQPASKGASGSGKEPAEGSTSKTRLYCKICRSKGHHAKQCPNRQADLENRVNFLTKQLSELTKGGSRTGSEAAWPHSPSPPGSSRPQAVININVLSHSKEFPKAPAWMVDGGASVHLVGDPELLHNYYNFDQQAAVSCSRNG